MPLTSTTLIDRLGLDLGQADPAPVAAAAANQLGARLVRVHFPLGGHTSADPAFLAAAKTSASMITSRGLQLLAVLDRDLTVAPGGMGALDDGPGSALATAWKTELLRHAEALAAVLEPHAAAFELLPAPNLRGPGRIAPSRWASLLVELGQAVRRVAPSATIVSGGLLSDEDDDGVDYLRAVYHAAGDAGWTPGVPPFDTLGIELRVLPDGGPSEQTVSTAIADRVRRLWRVREQYEGTAVAAAGGVLVTRVGWEALRVGEAAQARNVWTALNTLSSDPIVRGVIWASLADTPEMTNGLFRSQNLAADDRRPAWRAFYDFVEYARQITPMPMASVLGLGEVAAPAEPAPMVPSATEEPTAPVTEVPGIEPVAASPMPAAAQTTEAPAASAAEAPSTEIYVPPVDEIDAFIDRIAPAQAPASMGGAPESAAPGSSFAAEAPATEPPTAAPEEAQASDLGQTVQDLGETVQGAIEAGTETLSHFAEEAAESAKGWWQTVSGALWAPSAPATEAPAAAESLAEASDATATMDGDSGGSEPISESAPMSESATAAPMADGSAAEEAQAIATAAEPATPEVPAESMASELAEPVIPAESMMSEPAEPVIPAESMVGETAEPVIPAEPMTSGPAEPAIPAEPPAGEVLELHIPSLAEIVAAAGVPAERLSAVLSAITEHFGDTDRLAPGRYAVPLPPAPASAAAEDAGPPVDEGPGPLDLGTLTNQQVINAIYRAGQSSWGLFDRCGLSFGELALRRTERYSGPDFLSSANLTDQEREDIERELRAG